MCGIIAFIPKDNKSKQTGKHIIEQYQRQHSRGSQGFGLLEITKDTFNIERATEPTKALMDARFSEATIHAFHHRYPTSTDNDMEQTHPFHISHDELKHDYIVLHNGVIGNAKELMKVHTEEYGYKYQTFETVNGEIKAHARFNDSEALAIEVARCFEGLDVQINATGSIAFIAIKVNKVTQQPLEMIWSRNADRPLEVVETNAGLLIASEVYHRDAETITAGTYESLDLQSYFKANKPHEEIQSLTSISDLKYPSKEVIQSVATGNKVGFGAKTEVITNPKIWDQDDEEDWGPHKTLINDRDTAFEKMSLRVVAEMDEIITDFFANMAYEEVDDNQAIDISNQLLAKLLERSEKARSVVRPFFDHQDDQMIEAMELDLEIEEPITFNDRMKNHEQRFSQIIS